MSDTEMLLWIECFGSGLRKVDGVFYLDWIKPNGSLTSTQGINLKDAVIGARLEQERFCTINTTA